MVNVAEIIFQEIEENEEYKILAKKVLETCFEVEKIDPTSLYVCIILTTPENIRQANKKYRDIDKETDVLSFPMFEREEIEKIRKQEVQENLGDIIISIQRVKKQAEEYKHSFKRELAYMLVHGFYHLMGYDHITEEDKKIMRDKEEKILIRIRNYKIGKDVI